MESNALVSLITVSLNSEKTIKDTIESIIAQTYPNIEYIIVDGLSKDGTLKIAKSYEDDFKKKGYAYKIISEKDKGLYDAMNKGIKFASGKIIGILNSDDFYMNSSVIERVAEKFAAEKAGVVYGDLLMVDGNDTGKVIRKWKAGKGDFRFGWNPPHPSTFIAKKVYRKYGLYKTEQRLAADYDLLYRVMHKGRVRASYIGKPLIKMRIGGVSTRGIGSVIAGSREIYNSLKENGHRLKAVTVILRLAVKLKQLVIL